MQNECGISNFNGTITLDDFKNINGIDARIDAWAIKIMFGFKNDLLGLHCSGTIISPWHAITASHCLLNYVIIAGVACVYDIGRELVPNATFTKCVSTRNAKKF